MALPTFNTFSLQDSNWITERIVFKGYASREVIRAKVNRREGVKLLATEFGEKQVTIEGRVIASSASALQTLLDNMKYYFTQEEGDLVIESGRTFLATVASIDIPDEHYSQSSTKFGVTFVLTNPYSEGDQLSVTIPVVSGQATISGLMTISGTLFARPTITYNPAGALTTGHTNIAKLQLYHVPTGITTTVSGFGSGTDLGYQNSVVVNLDTFAALEGTSAIGATGGFPRWEVGTNQFTLTATPRFPSGSITVTYKPRYL